MPLIELASRLLGAALAAGRLHPAVGRALGRPREALWGLLEGGLSADERSRVGVGLYDASSEHRGLERFAWEDEWLSRALPKPPARVLVGACGGGREMVHLLDAGYETVGFDPVPGMLELGAERTGGRARFSCCRYEELTAAVLDGTRGPGSELARERFDAVLLGWGSLSHVLDPHERRRLIEASHALCPRGPILATFIRVPPGGLPPTARSRRIGERAGRLVAALRRLPREEHRREIVYRDLGFAHVFVQEEIAELGACVQRTVTIGDASDYGSGHVTFVPRALAG